MQLCDLFDLSLVGRAAAPALDVEDADGRLRTLTFGEIAGRAARMAHALAARGIQPGDRVAVYLPNGLPFIELFLACLRLGAILTPINILYRERELAHFAADADPAMIVRSDAGLDMWPAGAPLVDVADLCREADASSDAPIKRAIDGDSPAAIVYTSGSTGRSKGAVLSHNNLLANTANLVSCWRITSEDRYLAALPLFHVHGLANGLCSWLATGCRMRLLERFEHQRASAIFDDFQPTLFFGVPTIYTRLIELPDDAARRIGRQARLFVSGSAPLAIHVFDAFERAFGHRILERYGMSEALMLISNPYVGERRAGAVGAPLPGVSARLVGRDGQTPADGEIAQLEVRGPTVFQGYWRNPQATADAFHDGWFKTGDLAERSPDGCYTLRGRVTDLIISGGFNIYPREIEELLAELPTVREAAVVGVPDARRGEAPIAYVVADAEFDPDAARALCARSLASFKMPRAFVRIPALPRNALGKVQKHLLPAPGPEA